MPMSYDAPIVPNPNRVFWGEAPRTRFCDWIDAIRVDLLHAPERETLFLAMAQMREMTWAHDLDDLDERARRSMMGSSLPLSLEVPTFVFRVSGVSRIITHQIVRTRVGAVYSQRGTGDQDCRHDDVLVPRSLNREESRELLERYIACALDAKMLYSDLVDTRTHSLVAARYVLPQNLAQMIIVGINLAALSGLVGKRLCTFETLEYNVVAGKMRDLVVGRFPEFAPLLRPDCDKSGGCHYQRGFGTHYAGTVYAPDAKHDVGPWHPESYVYPVDRDTMLAGPPFRERVYVGTTEVSVR